jgi:uncharacterized protein (TIGR02646 family)
MISIKKDFDAVPAILNKANREEAFKYNLSQKKYVDEKNLYKVGSVQKALNDLYHLKCAYCEQKLLDSPKHIEHYRPKDIYYWLAYSWDNLLLWCGSCNSAKGRKFEILDSKVEYDGEAFENIHGLGKSYDKKENPLIINPEQDDVLELITFDVDGKIDSMEKRVNHTIYKACKLNREELKKLRLEIINDFKNSLEEHFTLFLLHKDITRFQPDIKLFKEKCKVEEEFYAFRYFIVNNVEVFFEDNRPLQKIVKILMEKI